jgi:hypothetical protein
MPAPSDSPAAAFALAAIANAAAMAVQQDEWSEEANASTFLPPTLSSRGYSSADLHAELAAAQLRLQVSFGVWPVCALDARGVAMGVAQRAPRAPSLHL